MKELVILNSENRRIIALIKDEELVEKYEEDENNKSIEGNIYVGKVQNVLTGLQSAFVNMSIFDESYAESLFGGLEFPDGTLFIDCIPEFMEHQKLFMETVSEIRTSNMFTYPVLTYSLLYKDYFVK